MISLFWTGVIAISISCQGQPDYIPNGRLLFNVYGVHRSVIEYDSMRSSYTIEYDNLTECVSLMNNENSIIKRNRYQSINNENIRSNIVKLELNRNFEELLYESLPNEIDHPEHLSWNDSLLLITMYSNSKLDKSPFDAIIPMVSICVYNMHTKERKILLQNVGRIPNVSIRENSWLHDNQSFVWSIDHGTEIIDGISSISSTDYAKMPAGVYIFDTETGNNSLLIPNGSMPVVSPACDLIAYNNDDGVMIYDYRTSKIQTVFKPNNEARIYKKLWSPDGKYMHIGYRLNDRNKHVMIFLDNLEEVKVNNIGRFNLCRSWKKDL